MIDHLRTFLAVLKEGSINAAASRLRMSQPALSRKMQALEQEVGGILFERTSAGIRPTPAGLLLARKMEKVLTEYDLAIQEVRSIARGQSEELRVGYLMSAANAYLGPALSIFRRTHPHAKVSLFDLSPGEQIQALREGKIDLALIGQEGKLLTRDFYAKKIATLGVMAILPTDHPLAGRRSIHLKDLRGIPFVSSPDEEMPGRDRWITQLCRKAGFRPRFIQVAQSFTHTLALVVSENATALAPDYIKDFPAPAVSLVPIIDSFAKWECLVVWQRGKSSASLHALVEALTHVSNHPPRGFDTSAKPARLN